MSIVSLEPRALYTHFTFETKRGQPIAGICERGCVLVCEAVLMEVIEGVFVSFCFSDFIKVEWELLNLCVVS